MRYILLATAVAASLLLASCNTKNRGVNPVLQPEAIETSTSNQLRILSALAIDYGITSHTDRYWYNVAQAGFNFVDDECRVYFNELFYLNREREQIKAGLATASATAAAILGVTGASTKSIAIVTQAFGLGIAATELVAGTYLYQTPPATALGFVKELQLAYREGAALRRDEVTSPTAAYHAVQDYLSLCLPPTIEAKIAEHIASARAAPDPLKRGAGSSFGLTVVSLPQVTRGDIASAVINNVDSPLPKPITQKQQTLHRLGSYEPSILVSDIKALQKSLCVKADGDLGEYGSETRAKIYEVLKKMQETDSTIEPTRVIGDARTAVILRRYTKQPSKCESPQ